ncbi:MAG: GIN domain-containing protein [Flavobacteriaceae bacterium]
MKFKIILLALFVGTFGFSQKKEKIKGNKFVKVKQHQIAEFKELNLNDKFEVFILKGDTPQVEIETDENLHDIIQFGVDDKGTLNLSTSHQIVSKKKLNIRITVTDKLNSIITSEKAIVNSLIDLDLKKMTINAKDNSKVFITIKTDEFKLVTEKSAKVELNLNTTKSILTLSESSNLKALINSDNLKIDLYQKANAKIEGEVDLLELRADNASNFHGEKLTSTDATVIAEGSSDCDLEVKNTLTLEASGSSEVNIYNTPKIELKRFEDSAAIYKK